MRYVKFEWLISKNSERGRYLGENFQPSKLPDGFEFLLVQHSINIKKKEIIKKDNDTIELKNIVTKIYKKCYELVRS